MSRPASIAFGVLLLAATATAKCDPKCMPKTCLQDDETALASAVDKASAAGNALKTTEPLLRAAVAQAKTAVNAANTNETAMEKAQTHAEGALEACNKMMNESSAEYKAAQNMWEQITSDCTGKTTVGASRVTTGWSIPCPLPPARHFAPPATLVVLVLQMCV